MQINDTPAGGALVFVIQLTLKGAAMTGLPRAVASALFFGIVLGISGSDHTFAQNPAAGGLLADGNAVVSGFSGAQLPTLIAPGVDPAEKTFIDLNGASVRVIDIQSSGAPPQGQLIATTKPFTATAGQVGQVFAVALDDATPPNVYAAATSVYGLPIVVPPAGGGEPARAQQGGPNAAFMPGLFGPQAQQGGPGSIWRIDGASGAVSLFANVTLDGAANSGPALGGLAFDPATKSLFVADRETGMIHRFDMTGAERGRYDHGTQGRQAAGRPPVPFDQGTRLNITSPQFQPANPQTWGYAPPPRRIFGLAVHDGRLYYAVAENLQIWSVSIAQDGAFGTDARIEITVSPGQGPSEISKIAFDDQGRMLLAERAAPSGAYDFAALTAQGGRVLRYPMVPSPGGPAPTPDEYAIGFAEQMRNGNGGIAIGYGYDSTGRLDRNALGGFLWSTGEQLRVSSDTALAAQLAQGGPATVNGLQGNDINLILPADAPPRQTYFVDYDDTFDDAAARGHMGDVAVFRASARVAAGGLRAPQPPGPVPPLSGQLPGQQLPGQPGGAGGPADDAVGDLGGGGAGGPGGPPPGVCPAGTHVDNGLQCCPKVGNVTTVPDANGQCHSHCANGSLDPKDNLTCELGFQPNHGPPGAGAYAGPILGAGGPLPLLCSDGQPPTVTGAGPPSQLNRKCKKPPLTECQSGFHVVYAGGGAVVPPNWEWSDATCVPDNAAALACVTGGGQVGLNGACQQICPGQAAFPINQCCWNGTAPNAQGHCDPGIFVGVPGPKQKSPPLPNGACPVGTQTTFLCCPRWWIQNAQGQCASPCANGATDAISLWACYHGFAPPVNPATWRPWLPGAVCANGQPHVQSSVPYVIPNPQDDPALWGNNFKCPAPPAPANWCPAGTAKTPIGPLGNFYAPTLANLGARWSDAACYNTAAQNNCAAQGLVEGPDHVTCVLNPCPANTMRYFTCDPELLEPPPSCAGGYLPTREGQCCLASQMTPDGQCCAVGTRPDAARRKCVPVTPPCEPTQRLANGQCCPPGTWPNNRRMTCEPTTPPPPTCERSQMTVTGECCPAGTRPDAARRTCVPATPPCEPAQRLANGQCCPAGTWPNNRSLTCEPTTPPPCPPGQHPEGRTCVPDVVITRCPPGQHRVDHTCVPDWRVIECPHGKHRVGRVCVPDERMVRCPPGQHRVGARCVPWRLELRQQPSQRQFRRPPPHFEYQRSPQPQFRGTGPH